MGVEEMVAVARHAGREVALTAVLAEGDAGTRVEAFGVGRGVELFAVDAMQKKNASQIRTVGRGRERGPRRGPTKGKGDSRSLLLVDGPNIPPKDRERTFWAEEREGRSSSLEEAKGGTGVPWSGSAREITAAGSAKTDSRVF